MSRWRLVRGDYSFFTVEEVPDDVTHDDIGQATHATRLEAISMAEDSLRSEKRILTQQIARLYAIRRREEIKRGVRK